MNRNGTTILIQYYENLLIILLILIIKMTNIVDGGNDLYNDFNQKLDKLSIYAEKNYDQTSAEQLNRLYDKSAILLNNHINKKRSSNINSNTINDNNNNNNNNDYDDDIEVTDMNLKNLLNVLLPYYNNQYKMDTIEKKINWIKRNPKKFQQFYTKQQQTSVNNNNNNKHNNLFDNNIKKKRNFNKNKVIKRNIIDDTFNQQQSSDTTANLFQFDTKSLMNLNPSSLYPSVVAKTTDLSHLNDFVANSNTNNNQLGGINDGTASASTSQLIQQPAAKSIDTNSLSQYSNLLSLYNQPQLQQKIQSKSEQQPDTSLTNSALSNNFQLNSLLESSKLPRYSFFDHEDLNKKQNQTAVTNPPPSAASGSGASSTDDCKFNDPNNASAVLERVLQELELIRQVKEGNGIPEGMPCNIVGSWNSEMVGLRFDINTTNKDAEQHDLSIKLLNHRPPKKFTLMDITWACTGYALHLNGGPFYISAAKKKEEVLVTFAGVCKTCGGVDTIFGTWTIVHPASDCRDLQMAIETKRDIFRKETIHLKRKEKLEHLKKSKVKDEIKEVKDSNEKTRKAD